MSFKNQGSSDLGIISSFYSILGDKLNFFLVLIIIVLVLDDLVRRLITEDWLRRSIRIRLILLGLFSLIHFFYSFQHKGVVGLSFWYVFISVLSSSHPAVALSFHFAIEDSIYSICLLFEFIWKFAIRGFRIIWNKVTRNWWNYMTYTSWFIVICKKN